MSLGNAQGVAVLGRPLDLSFAVRTDGVPIAESCVTADVVAGDAPVASGQVRVTPQAGAAGMATVRVQTTQPVVEPILTVRLAAGCSGAVVRNYTVLAFPPEAVPTIAGAPVAQAAPPAAAPPGAVPAPSHRANSAPADAPARAARPPAPRRERPAADAPANRPAARARATAPVAASNEGRPRLVMEPLADLADWLQAPPLLRASPEMAGPSDATTPAQREAAQAQWRALNLEPEAMLAEGVRLAEQDAARAKELAQARQDQAAALAAQKDWQEAAEARFPASLVYALAALLLLLLALLAWLAGRLRREKLQQEVAWTDAVARNGTTATPSSSAAGPVWPQPAGAASDGTSRLQPAEPEMLPSGVIPLEFHTEPAQRAPAPSPVPSPAPVAAPVAAVVNPEELFDLQQQAEFFVSVGEHDQAIEVMKRHIEANESTSPSAYLELLRLYRSLSRIEPFNQLRAQFHRHFNAQVPEFSAFARAGKTLFAYPDVLARIEALWPEASVVALLQELLFQGDGRERQRFDLSAYDDLLLLHAVARTTPPATRAGLTPRVRTTPQADELAPAAVATPAPAPMPDRESEAQHRGNLLEFEPDWDFEAPNQPPHPQAPQPPQAFAASSGMALDLDLSDLTHLDGVRDTGDTSRPLPFLASAPLPPVPASAPPAPDQPVGFGANSDRFEARVDPDERKPR